MTSRQVTANDIRLIRRSIGTYPRWQQVRDSLQQTASELVPEGIYDFQTMSNILLATADKFFKLEDEECRSLSKQLVSMEDHEGSGRVFLKDFYRPAFSTGMLEFTESTDYLRQQGALDESNPQSPRVIIPNYIMADSNCLANSEYYSVCCSDPCEELMDQIELALQAPSATPQQLVAVVESLPANVSEQLHKKLEEVAENYNGEVPIHGRLFAQWMHHTFPRQCPYPHLANTVNKQSLGQFTAERHETAAFADFQEMKELMDSHMSHPSGDRFGMWSEDEELVDPLGFQQHIENPRRKTWACFWILPFVGGFMGMLIKLSPVVSTPGGSIYHQKVV